MWRRRKSTHNCVSLFLIVRRGGEKNKIDLWIHQHYMQYRDSHVLVIFFFSFLTKVKNDDGQRKYKGTFHSRRKKKKTSGENPFGLFKSLIILTYVICNSINKARRPICDIKRISTAIKYVWFPRKISFIWIERLSFKNDTC